MSGLSLLVGFISCLACFNHGQAIYLSPTTVSELDGVVTFNVTVNTTVTPFFLTYTLVDGTATGSNYALLSPTTLSGGSDGFATFDVNITDNADYTGDLTFDVNFVGGANIADTIPMSVTVTIEDDEPPPIELTQPENMTVTENHGKINITLQRDPLTTRAFNISFFNTGTALEPDDFEFDPMSSITFAENENEMILMITITDDKIEEETKWICVYINSTEFYEPIVFYIHILDNDTPMSFHCLRESQRCKNGRCNTTDFICECDAGFVGADCSIDDTMIDVPPCTPACVNGTCADGECICDPGFAGEVCDKSAYYHDCTATSFVICLTPYGIDDFVGEMYVDGMRDVDECRLKRPVPDDDIPDWCDGYAAVIDFNGTCGEFGPLDGIDPTTYEIAIKIHYTENISKSSDEKVWLICKKGEPIIISAPTMLDGNDQHFPQFGESDFAPATLELQDVLGNPLPDPLTSPAVIYACLSVKDVPAYDHVVIDFIMIDNGRAPPDYRSEVMYDEGCFPRNLIFDGPKFDPNDEHHTMCFGFEAFIFQEDVGFANPGLVLTVNFTVGVDPDPYTVHSCTGRRKRQAINNEEKTLQARINLRQPVYESSEKIESTEGSTCARWLYPAFICVGVVALAMMVIIIILTVAVCRRIGVKKEPKDVYQ